MAMWAVAAACGGEISLTGSDPGPGAPSVDGQASPYGSGSNGSGKPGAPRDGEAGSGSETDALRIAPAPATRAARLTHAQWENSIRDLFGLATDTSFSDLLRADPVQNGFLFDNDSSTMVVDDALASGYQQAAAAVAEYVTGDADRLAAITPSNAGDAATQAQRLVEALGLRAHRRPLTDQESAEYVALYRMAPALYDGISDAQAGTRLVIEAMLQSPDFLYRVERSATLAAGLIPLSSYEVASRLSYALWNTMPDAALFAAAQGDGLRDSKQVALQAQRMLDDPRAQSMVARFHDQLLEVNRFAGIHPSTAMFPNLAAEFGAYAATESRSFVRETVFAERGSYASLLTSNETFVNADLAAVYGLAGSFDDHFTKVTLDPAQRKGIFTQLGFLALNATSVNPDPIHRGVFLARRITCATIAAPPANITPLPEAQGRTNRETVEAHTQKPDSQCASCHSSVINPLGFPFESFDAIGRYRTTDNGHPVDTTAEAWTGTERVKVNGALELGSALAQSRAVHECYAQHWLEFAYGRPRAEQDAGLIANLADRSLREELPIADLVMALVTSPAFLNRSPQELP